MLTMRAWGAIAVALALGMTVLACTPEVGSERWCTKMDKKSKGDWTANEAADYAKHCVFR